MLKFKILSENGVRRRGIIGEHGLSILIEVDGFKVLFDAGQTNIFSQNAVFDGVDLKDVNALVLSHGHYDHTGGVPEFCEINTTAPIYIHPEAFRRREHWNSKTDESRSIGISWSESISKQMMERFQELKNPLQIHEKVWVSGEFEVQDLNEMNISGFFTTNSKNEKNEDLFIDEQFIMVRGSKGIYIFNGCSHKGVINCIKHTKTLFPEDKIEAIIGGMHLEYSSLQKISIIASRISGQGITKVFPMHCTGVMACTEFKRIFENNCVLLNCGDEFLLEE